MSDLDEDTEALLKQTLIERMRKNAFATNAFSGAMNPTIATGASDIPAFRAPGLRAPVQKVASKILDYNAPLPKKKDRDRPATTIELEQIVQQDADKDTLLKHGFKLQGHDEHQGLGIAIENKPGSVRKGVTDDGKKWRTVMKNAYGYIKGTHGADGEEVDCYLGPKKDASHAHVVHQRKPDGTGYDEDKVMLGFGSKEEARKAYLAHYDDPKFLGPMKSVPMERFKALIDAGKKLVKISASSPTRGGFLLASDIPAFKSPSLSAPVEKTSDMLPDYVSTNDGVGFKRSKYAKKIPNDSGDQYELDRSQGDSLRTGEVPMEFKVADISPTSPLGNGGGNPHRAQSDLPAFRGPNLRAPLTKVSEFSDISTYNGGPSSAGRAPVNERGFRQAGDQPGIPVNSLRAPLVKHGAFGISPNPMGAAHASKMVGTSPMLKGAPGPDIAKLTKPPGKGFGGPLPGATKAGVGNFNAGAGT